MDYSVALTAVGETVTCTDADCLAHYLLLNILVSLSAPHLRCKCAFIFYYFLFLLELTVLQLSMSLYIQHYNEDSFLDAVCSEGTFIIHFFYSMNPFSYIWMAFFFSENLVTRVGNSLCLLTLLPARKNNTFSCNLRVILFTLKSPQIYISLLITALDRARHLTGASAWMWAACFSQ